MSALVCLCLREPGAAPVWGQARNVSVGGLFVQTDDEIPLYAPLDLLIYPGAEPAFRARAIAVQRRGGGVGICFARISAQARLHLERWLGRSGGLQPVSGVIERSGTLPKPVRAAG
jgi:hypothetical protein